MTESSYWRRRDGLVLLGIGLLAFLAYSRALLADFVGYDDLMYIHNRPLVMDGLSWAQFCRAWTALEFCNWHPLTWLSYMVERELYGLNATGFHLTNLVVHAVSSGVLYAALLACGLRRGMSAFIALVFAVHPLHVESVAWISERKDVLSGLFWNLSLWAYAAWVRRPGWGRWGVIPVLVFLGLASKAMVVTLPCVLVLLDIWPLRRWSGSQTWGESTVPLPAPRSMIWLIAEKWPLWLLSVAVGLLAVVAQRAGSAMLTLDRLPLDQRLANVVISYVVYLQKTFWPVRLAVFYPYVMNVRPLWWFVLALLGLLAVSVIAVLLRKRVPGLLIGWLWFLGTLAPVIGLLQAGEQALADRYMYIPIVGVTLALATCCMAIVSRLELRGSALSPATFGIVVVLTALSWRQTACWKNTETLARQALAVTRENYVAHFLLGQTLIKTSNLDESEFHLREALRIHKSYDNAHNMLGVLYAKHDRLDDAIREYRLGLAINSKNAKMHLNLGNALARSERYDEAVTHYRLALEHGVERIVGLKNLANCYRLAGKRDEALQAYRELLELSPDPVVRRDYRNLLASPVGPPAERSAARQPEPAGPETAQDS